MKYREKNDGGIELHVEPEERKLLYRALRHYSAYHQPEKDVIEDIPKICEIMNVLDLPSLRIGEGSGT